jgi:hypothetical protein
MKKYIYKGPDSGITLQDRDTRTDVLLRNGKATPPLPENNAAVKTLVAMGYLVEVKAEGADPHPNPLPPAGEVAGKAASPSVAGAAKPTTKSTKAAKE